MALGKDALPKTDSLVASTPFFQKRLSKEQEHKVLHVHPPVAHWEQGGVELCRRPALSSVSDTQVTVPQGELPKQGPMRAPGVRYYEVNSSTRLLRAATGQGLSRFQIISLSFISPALFGHLILNKRSIYETMKSFHCERSCTGIAIILKC